MPDIAVDKIVFVDTTTGAAIVVDDPGGNASVYPGVAGEFRAFAAAELPGTATFDGTEGGAGSGGGTGDGAGSGDGSGSGSGGSDGGGAGGTGAVISSPVTRNRAGGFAATSYTVDVATGRVELTFEAPINPGSMGPRSVVALRDRSGDAIGGYSINGPGKHPSVSLDEDGKTIRFDTGVAPIPSGTGHRFVVQSGAWRSVPSAGAGKVDFEGNVAFVFDVP